MHAQGRSQSRGFTLIELMVTVAIVGILATLATFGIAKYIQSSKSSEAIQMIGAIKAAQEQYRVDTFVYKDVSGSHSLADSTLYPTTTPSSKVYAWGDTSTDQGKAWQELGVRADAPVRFAYGCAAGSPTDAVPGPGTSFSVANWPTTQSMPWYVVRAVGDLDGDGVRSVFVSSSFTSQIFIDKEGE